HLAGQIVIIDHGRVVAAGTPAELKRTIGSSVLEVHARQAEDLPAIARALTPAAGTGTAEVDETTRRVRVALRTGTGDDALVDAIRRVREAGCAFDDIAVRQPDLDEVFLTLTGDNR